MNDTTTDIPVATGGRDRGFTLIELLIVIVILGVLATVTVFAVRGISDRGKTSACDADKKTLETAIESYFAQNAVSAIPAPASVPPDDTATPGVNESLNVAGTLVSAQLLRSPSAKYIVLENGTLQPHANSGCTA